MRPERETLSPDGAARLLGVSVDTVYRLIHRGELEAVRAGQRHVILAASVADFLERAEHEDAERLYDRSMQLARLYTDKAVADDVDAYFELAEAKLKRAAVLRPTDPLPRYERVRLLLRRGREKEAEEAFAALEASQDAALADRRRARAAQAE